MFKIVFKLLVIKNMFFITSLTKTPAEYIQIRI